MSKELKGGDLTLVNCTLLDPTASMKMVLWENFINQVENNRTYIFHNVTVRKDKYNDTIYLNTSQYGTEIKLTEDFTEILAVPLNQDNTQYVSTTIEGVKECHGGRTCQVILPHNFAYVPHSYLSSTYFICSRCSILQVWLSLLVTTSGGDRYNDRTS